LFIDEIGELHPMQINKLLKVLEDRKVMLESAYYSSSNKNIPTYIHDIFQNGIPADFRLIGATTRRPDEIPPAVRSRCVEIYFNQLSREDIEKIIHSAAEKFGISLDEEIVKIISRYARNGREAIKILQTLTNIIALDGRSTVTKEDAQWVIKAGRYADSEEKIIDISLKPRGKIYR
jgi:Lon-like ATP-dependent protease